MRISARKRKPTWMETDTTVFERGVRPLLVRLNPDWIECHPKGTRTSYMLPYNVIFAEAIQRLVELRRREKRAASRKGSKRK